MKNSLRRGVAAQLILVATVSVGLLAFAIFYWNGSADQTALIQPILSEVTRGEFVSQVLDQGEVQSSANVEIRCEARARNGSISVLKVTPEGSSVKGGDFLVQLDSTSFEKELEQQNIAMATAETSVIQAESALATAQATKEEYIKGVFEQSKKEILTEEFNAISEINAAKQNLETAEQTYAYSKKLQLKGYVTNQSVQADFYRLENAKNVLRKWKLQQELAQERLRVLTDISFKKETVQLDADIKAAEVKLNSQIEAQKVEAEKLAEIEEQIENCTIRVPEGVSGQVVYAKESSRGGNDWVLEEGTSVRQNQVLVRLPDPERMEVKALINEQSITQIEANMPATIKVDALNDTTLKGVVTKVNQYAESNGWMSSTIRKYAVFVRILDPPPTLKPGMNASVTIQVQYESDVLMAPIQTVYAVQGRHFCLAKAGEDQWKTLEVEIGGDNSQMVLIRDGIEEGEQLVMNPGAYKEYMDLPEFKLDAKIELPDDVKNEIAKQKSEAKQKGRPGGKGKQDGPGGPGGRGGSQAGGGSGGPGGFSMPKNGAEFIAQKDTDGDGKLTKDEIGSPMSNFFSYIDTDGDGFVTEPEAEKSVQSMRKRMQGGGFGGGPGR
ncbi:MAG: HlyD family efflux transporter periplasmic adaptor subunit [Planctomycetota bacterium]